MVGSFAFTVITTLFSDSVSTLTSVTFLSEPAYLQSASVFAEKYPRSLSVGALQKFGVGPFFRSSTS